MSTPMTETASKKPTWKAIYLDTLTVSALEFLKSQPTRGGMRFSNAALFREFLDHLRRNTATMLKSSGWSRRGEAKGKLVSVPLTADDKANLAWLVRYYEDHAPGDTRVRDRQPKIKRLPISQLYADYIRDHARRLGWRPPPNSD
jgi:hypothetical protein